MSDVQPLSWKKIILCAIAAVPVSMAIGYGIVIPFEEALRLIPACYFVLVFVPLAMIVGFLLGLFSTRHRRSEHAILATLGSLLLSIIVGIGFVLLVIT